MHFFHSLLSFFTLWCYFFLLFAVMQWTSLIIFRWQIKTLMVKIPIKQMTSDRFYVHKIKCKKTVASTVNDPFCIIYWHTKHRSNEKKWRRWWWWWRRLTDLLEYSLILFGFVGQKVASIDAIAFVCEVKLQNVIIKWVLMMSSERWLRSHTSWSIKKINTHTL